MLKKKVVYIVFFPIFYYFVWIFCLYHFRIKFCKKLFYENFMWQKKLTFLWFGSWWFWDSAAPLTSTRLMTCKRNSWASCCRLEENSGCPLLTRALNIRGEMPLCCCWNNRLDFSLRRRPPVKLHQLLSQYVIQNTVSSFALYAKEPTCLFMNNIWISHECMWIL